MGDEAESPETSDRLSRWRRATDWPLMALAVGSLPILLIEIERTELPHSDQLFIDIVNLTVLIAFAFDYLVELLLSDNRRRYVRTEWTSLLIVIAQAIALVPALAAVGALRALRAGRLFRLMAIALRAAAIGGSASKNGRQMIRDHAAALAFSVAGLTWLTAAAAFTLVEDVGVGRRVDSFGDALWWALSTITTVGYGDVYPVTAAGRVVGGFTMVIGVSVFAVVTAKVASFLVRSDDAPPADAAPTVNS